VVVVAVAVASGGLVVWVVAVTMVNAPLSQAELQMTISEAQPQYEAVAVAVRRGKVQLETALSKHFKGTKVNLMGEINNI
tara:strand:- start:898 stop:1137 length:240 start_codon:yes stop_codon:yes gene_type:complete